MSLVAIVTLFACIIIVIEGIDVVRSRAKLHAEMAAHIETKNHFRRQAVAEWAKKMPLTGKIAIDPFCPKDVVYCINPSNYRGPDDPEAA